MNTAIIIIVAVAALALITFVTVKNIRDRKRILPPNSTDDKVMEEHMDKSRRRNQL